MDLQFRERGSIVMNVKYRFCAALLPAFLCFVPPVALAAEDDGARAALSLTSGLSTFFGFACIVLAVYVVHLRKRIKELEGGSVAGNPEPAPAPIPAKEEPVPQDPAPEPVEEESTQPEWMQFLRKYTVLSTRDDAAESVKLSESLRESFAILSFSCQNITERRSDPGAAPVFSDAPDGDFWALKDIEGDNYYVFPQPFLEIDQDKNDTHGLKEAFASNFKGGEYLRFRVAVPAVFHRNGDGIWKDLRPGKILLLEEGEE